MFARRPHVGFFRNHQCTDQFREFASCNALSGHLNAGDAILITANAGTLHNEVFLVVDMNGIAGYQTDQDLVIDVTGYSGTLTTGDFS